MYSSGVLCYRKRPPLHFSFAGNPCSFPDRSDNRPSLQASCFCCCPCCCVRSGHCGGSAFYGLGLDLDTWLFYGLRQSSLLRRSALRSAVLASGTGYSCRYQDYGFDGEVGGGYDRSSLGGRREGRRRRMKCTVPDGERGGGWFSRLERADAVIRLLSEEVGEESLGLREKEGSLRNKALARKKRNDGGVHSKGSTKYPGAGRSKKEPRSSVESIEINATDLDDMEEREKGELVSSRRENRGIRREGSSCSSYHSVLSSGEYKDGVEEIKCDEFPAQASNRYGKDSRKAAERNVKKEILEDYEQHEVKKKRSEILQQRRESASSFIDWDQRKKSEKRLSEVSIDKVESCMKSVQEKSITSRTSGQEDVRLLSSQIQIRGGERKSSLGVTIEARTGNLPDHKETAVRIVGGPDEISKKASEFCSFCGGDVNFLSQSENQPLSKKKSENQLATRREEEIVVSRALVTERVDDQDGEKAVTAKREKFIRNPPVLSVELDIRGTNSEMTTEFSRNSEAWVNSTMIEEKHMERSRTNKMVHQEKQSMKSEQSSESQLDIQTVSLPQLDNTKSPQKESHFTSSSTGNRIIRSPQRHPEIQTAGYPSKESSAVINQSLSYAVDTISVASNQRFSNETTINNNNFMSVVVLAGETEKGNNQIRETVASIESKTGQDSVDQTNSFGDTRIETSTSQDLDLVLQSGAPKTDMGGSKTLSQSPLISPPSQLLRRESSPCGRTDVTLSQEGYYVHNSHSSSTHVEVGRTRFDRGEVKVERDDHSVMLTTDGYALESAIRSEETSRKFLGEFIEQTVCVSNSDIHVSDSTLTDQGRFDGKTSYPEIVSEGSPEEARDKRNPAEGPGTKGPSDEILHDNDMSIQEIPKTESLEGHMLSGNTVVRRSGRTLWRMIGDIPRLRWGNSHSAVPSGGRISSNMSVSSETCFSGHEAVEIIENNDKPLEAAAKQLQPVRTLTENRMDMRVSDQGRQAKAEIEISPLFETKNDSASKLSSSTSSHKDFTWSKDTVGSPPVTAGLSKSSLPLPERGVTASLGVASSSGKVSVCESGSLPASDESSNMSAEVIAQEDTNVELKQRKKFQRKQQIPRDRFDEWEEAYKHEHAQRQIDEMFMREALLEAKKAGDNWEIPVGAVLVQHGKIIARGCNLVEQLRDSTAHAEILCIREASIVLKSWRLAETTLYVTLEPCTMCAGAILQARVDTLVWGVPNTLLGADGSYIRLFPVEEGEGGSQVIDKPAPPVHPFHPKMTIRRRVLASECTDAMQQFFQLRRKKDKKDELEAKTSGLPVSPHPSKLLHKMHNILHIMFCL